MTAQNTKTNYLATNQPQSSTYATSSDGSESRFDKGFILSIRGILKIACLLFCFIAFVCLVTTAQCGGTHVFLGTVTWLVILMQALIIVVFVLRLQTKFPAIDFDLLDFFVTSHDALYLLIASSVTIHYCPIPGQVAGATLGLLACVFLIGNAVTIFMARRNESIAKANSNSGTR